MLRQLLKNLKNRKPFYILFTYNIASSTMKKKKREKVTWHSQTYFNIPSLSTSLLNGELINARVINSITEKPEPAEQT
jgi:hypothetical protein